MDDLQNKHFLVVFSVLFLKQLMSIIDSVESQYYIIFDTSQFVMAKILFSFFLLNFGLTATLRHYIQSSFEAPPNRTTVIFSLFEYVTVSLQSYLIVIDFMNFSLNKVLSLPTNFEYFSSNSKNPFNQRTEDTIEMKTLTHSFH